MYLDIALFILVSILIVLIILCIPVLLQIWRITKDLSMSLQTLNQSLPLILKNMEDITTNLNSSTDVINKKIQNFGNSSTLSHFLTNDLLNHLQYLAPLALKFPVFRILRNIAAVAKGMRVFAEVLLNKEKDETAT